MSGAGSINQLVSHHNFPAFKGVGVLGFCCFIFSKPCRICLYFFFALLYSSVVAPVQYAR